MSKRQDYIDNIKTQLKEIPEFTLVQNIRTNPTRAQYPAVTFYIDEGIIETEALDYNYQTRTLSIVVHVFTLSDKNPEKSEYDMWRYTDLIEQTLISPDPTAMMKLTGIKGEVADGDSPLHRSSLFYELQYFDNINMMSELI